MANIEVDFAPIVVKDGKWHSYCFTIDDSSVQIKYYVDGERVFPDEEVDAIQF